MTLNSSLTFICLLFRLYRTAKVWAESRILRNSSIILLLLLKRLGLVSSGRKISSRSLARPMRGICSPRDLNACLAALTCPGPPSTTTRSGRGDLSSDSRVYRRVTASFMLAKSSCPATFLILKRR